jgi:murein DD-endopeptidase MepM/ murein hydrolase activator NlpD
MVWKVANYNSLRKDADSVRASYNTLQKEYARTNQQLAALQLLASEVSNAYGIKRKLEGPADISGEGRLEPTYNETIEQYNFLKTTRVSRFDRSYPRLWQTRIIPDLWPLEGRLLSSFGQRNSPFSGEMAFHTGIDISGSLGDPVRCTADGVVTEAGYVSGGYGRLVIVDHGGGVSTYYAHLSRVDVIAGQEVRRGQEIGAVGRSGRATGTHLHYEVRVGGSPVNPYRFLARSGFSRSVTRTVPF